MSAGARRWSAADIPDQSGRTAVVTGAAAGLGLETVKVLATCGATVVLAGHDLERTELAAERIRAETTRARLQVVQLDLASLRSVREAADEIRTAQPRLDLLINNAGVMQVPHERTADGLELTLATNHLGHFALTGLLLEPLLQTAGSRVVTVSSNAHRRGVMNFADLQSERDYDASGAYARSKLANLLFTYELNRRLLLAGAGAIALAAHPGNVRTGLWRTSSALERALMSSRLRLLNFWLAQGPRRGALPILRAASDPTASGGEYYGPGGVFEFTGAPTRVESSASSHDFALQRQLWETSEQLTGVSYPGSQATAA